MQDHLPRPPDGDFFCPSNIYLYCIPLSDFISLWQKYQENIAQQKSRPLERPAAEYIHITSANWDQRFSLSHLYAPYRNANVIIDPNIVLKFYRCNNTKKNNTNTSYSFFYEHTYKHLVKSAGDRKQPQVSPSCYNKND